MRKFIMSLFCGVAMVSLTACMMQPEPIFRPIDTTVKKAPVTQKAAEKRPAAKKKRLVSRGVRSKRLPSMPVVVAAPPPMESSGGPGGSSEGPGGGGWN